MDIHNRRTKQEQLQIKEVLLRDTVSLLSWMLLLDNEIGHQQHQIGGKRVDPFG